MKKLIPSKKQWRNWQKPSKLTAVGTLLGAVGLLATLVTGCPAVLHDWLGEPKSSDDKVIGLELKKQIEDLRRQLESREDQESQEASERERRLLDLIEKQVDIIRETQRQQAETRSRISFTESALQQSQARARELEKAVRDLGELAGKTEIEVREAIAQGVAEKNIFGRFSELELGLERAENQTPILRKELTAARRVASDEDVSAIQILFEPLRQQPLRIAKIETPEGTRIYTESNSEEFYEAIDETVKSRAARGGGGSTLVRGTQSGLDCIGFPSDCGDWILDNTFQKSSGVPYPLRIQLHTGPYPTPERVASALVGLRNKDTHILLRQPNLCSYYSTLANEPGAMSRKRWIRLISYLSRDWLAFWRR